MKNILELLETTSIKYPDKIAFTDNLREIGYQELINESKTIGSSLIKYGRNKPIIIFIDKTVNALSSMFGILYSGNFYCVIDVTMPKERIELIFNTLNPVCIITDEKNLDKVKSYEFNLPTLNINDTDDISLDELELVRTKMIDTDPAYVLFTSGSTGIPKGTVVTHRAVLSYTNWVTKTFDFNETTIFGSQTPFYFSMSVTDVFGTIATGATFHIIPKMLFSFPVKLLEFLNEKQINTIYWVPSALSIVANLGGLKEVKLNYLNKVLFAGEVMPVKQLNMWIEALPKSLFANLFGPTETTDICTYYIVDREFKDDETLPIGRHCDNCDNLIITEDGKEAEYGEVGELCARGSFLANGYYNNPEKTKEVFIQNPINNAYPEIIYKTGDLVKYNELGELIYLSRKDFQIKHMGYRIELGEIETAVNSIDGIISCACIYDTNSSKIVLYYVAKKLENNDILAILKNKLPNYMIPNDIIELDVMPINQNGKIDRVDLKNSYQERDVKNG